MKSMKFAILPWLIAQTYVGGVILAAVLPVLSGCATKGAVVPEQVVQSTPANRQPAVEQLADGRKGFVITEVSQLNDAARRHFQRAVTMLKNKEYEQAAGLLEKVIEQSPGVTAPYINIAIAYRHLDNLKQAEMHLKAALNLMPTHPVACNEYGMLYRKTGRFNEARAMYEKALDRFPDYYPVHRNLAILCDLYLDDLDCALEHYEIYGRTVPEDGQVQMWITDLRNRIKSR
jgi:Tfp pilus assembly protein PilF